MSEQNLHKYPQPSVNIRAGSCSNTLSRAWEHVDSFIFFIIILILREQDGSSCVRCLLNLLQCESSPVCVGTSLFGHSSSLVFVLTLTSHLSALAQTAAWSLEARSRHGRPPAFVFCVVVLWDVARQPGSVSTVRKNQSHTPWGPPLHMFRVHMNISLLRVTASILD